MPTFMKDRKRNPWRGQVKKQGYKTEIAYFPTKDEAKEFEENRSGVLRRKAKGLPFDIMDLTKITVGDMVKQYLKEETKYKASSSGESYRLENFLGYKDFRTRQLIAFRRPDAVEYRNYLEREHVFEQQPYIRDGKLIQSTRKPQRLKAGTVRRRIATLRDMWNIACRDWRGYEALKELGNPWSGVSSKAIPKKRTRRLDDLPSRKNELRRLLEACTGSYGLNKIYVRLAINLAVQCGMRLQEVLLVKLRDVDFKNHTININKSKTDYKSETEGRTVVMPFVVEQDLKTALYLLIFLAITEKSYLLRPEDSIIQLRSTAFKQAWQHVRERAGINSKEQDILLGIKESQCGLEFKDLRREAGSIFDEAGLTKAEHDLMLGHASQDMAGIYIAPHLAKINKKLNDHWTTDPPPMDKATINMISGIGNNENPADMFRRYIFDVTGREIPDSFNELLGKFLKADQVQAPIAETISNVIPFFRKQKSA